MNQVKIGRFIAQCRKNKNLTQAQLAEKLNITDRAISKWETGKGMPDSSIMLELCNELGINVNELLSGEMIKMDKYEKLAEENLLELKRLEEIDNKKLLTMEMVIGLTCSITFLIIMIVIAFAKMEIIPQMILIVTAVVIFIIGIFFSMELERKVGYYECDKCHYKYIPKALPFWFAMHLGRTRYMKCPKCNKRSWNKKTLIR